MEANLHAIAQNFAFATLEELGRTAENRSIWLLKVDFQKEVKHFSVGDMHLVKAHFSIFIFLKWYYFNNRGLMEVVTSFVISHWKNFDKQCDYKYNAEKHYESQLKLLICDLQTFFSKITMDESLPIIWIDAGIHAREWIASASAFYLIDMVFCVHESHACCSF